MSITIKKLTYQHPDREKLFNELDFFLAGGEKTAILGENGIGKSTLLHLINGDLHPITGNIICSSKPYIVPQHFGQYNEMDISTVLKIEYKLRALNSIYNGDISPTNFEILNDDWQIEERSLQAMEHWGLKSKSLHQKMSQLSGGEKTKVFLAGMTVHSPSIILLDEPTNHLDTSGREKLYEFIKNSKATIITVSHDKTLLKSMPSISELSKNEIIHYGDNYDFYKAAKTIEIEAKTNDINEKEKQLKQSLKTSQETIERREKQNMRGKKHKIKQGVPKIALGVLKDKSEKKTSKLQQQHDKKIESATEELIRLKKELIQSKDLKITLESSDLHHGKKMIIANNINFNYDKENLWKTPLNIEIISGERILLKGNNGSGKTTLVKLLTGQLKPESGSIKTSEFSYIYADQEYSLIDNTLTIYEQTELFNYRHLKEYELKTLLNRHNFTSETWTKKCDKLSGGEKMRLMLCCLIIGEKMPDIFILDEPTNNLDIKSAEILTTAVKNYQGTLIIISHDKAFINEIFITQTITL